MARGLEALRHGGRSLELELRQENDKLKVIIGQLGVELNYVKKKRGDGKMRMHFPAAFWTDLFKEIDKHGLSHELARRALGLNSSTFYTKLRQYRNGGVLPRKAGTGRKRKYETKDYEEVLRATINELPPMAGCQRIRMALRPKGIILGEGTVGRMVRELGLVVVRSKGRSRKRFEPLIVDGPKQIVVADTTTWWVERQKVQIYASVDAFSRYGPPLMVAMDRTAESTVDYYGKLFTDCFPAAVHTDNGKEFDNRNTFAYLEERSVMWRHGPSHTPQAQGLVERYIRTLKEEWLTWREPKSVLELQKSLDEFRDWYNRVRFHMSLDYRTPEVVHNAS